MAKDDVAPLGGLDPLGLGVGLPPVTDFTTSVDAGAAALDINRQLGSFDLQDDPQRATRLRNQQRLLRRREQSLAIEEATAKTTGVPTLRGELTGRGSGGAVSTEGQFGQGAIKAAGIKPLKLGS